MYSYTMYLKFNFFMKRLNFIHFRRYYSVKILFNNCNMAVALIAVSSVSLITQLIFQIATNDNDDGQIPWYESLIYRHCTFDETYVPSIDALLHNVRGNKIMNEHGMMVPDIGTYTFRFNGNKVKLIKVQIKKNNNYVVVYRARVYRKHRVMLQRFVQYLANQKSPDEINIISIDTSKDTPSLVKLIKLCKTPKPNQSDAIDLIYNEWIKNNYEGLKVVFEWRTRNWQNVCSRIT